METVVIDIVGMRCQACVKTVNALLETIPGVGQVEVVLEARQARIAYDPELARVGQFRDAIEAAGFDTR